jgi:large repetitive protein
MEPIVILQLKITDPDGDVSNAKVSVTVTSVNDLPIAVDDNSESTNEDTPKNGNLASNDTPSGDGGNIWVINSNPSHGTVVVNADGTYTYIPTANYNGADNFTYSLIDADGDKSIATVTMNIVGVNDAPQAVNDIATTNEDTQTTISVLTNDTDVDGDALTVTGTTTPANGTVVVNGDGTITYTPIANYHGQDTFDYTISDGSLTSTATVTVTVSAVNDAPQTTNDSKITNEDTPTTISVLSNDTDVDGDAITVTGTTIPANGTVVVNGDGTITYTQIANYHGQDTFDYTISDGSLTSTATVTITVTSVNDTPQAVNDIATTNEDTQTTISVLTNDTDMDGDALTVTTTTSPSHGNAVVNADGTITYTPTANFHGSDTFDYTISDGNGGTGIATVTITVVSVNNTPLAANDVATTNEDVPMTITVLSNDTDGDGDVLSVIGVTPPLNGGAVVNINGTITYTPNPNFNGTDTFKYTVTDGNGGTSTANVTIIVNSVNDAPTTVNDIGSTDEDIPVLIAVLSNDTDVDGDALAVTTTTAPSHGTVIVKSDGTIIYTPNPNFNGIDTFDYSVNDGNGGVSTATVSITVNSVNDAPLAVTDVITTDEDTPVIIHALTNDIDVDGDPLSVVSITNPLHGTAVVNTDGTITYTPEANFNGTDAFEYTLTDGNGASSIATVNLVVNSLNDNPLAITDAASVEESNQIVLPVLNNDADPEGDILIITKTTKPANGELTVNTNGSVIYVPNADFHGIDTFNYTVSDGSGGQSTAVVTINVFKVNKPPVAKNDSRSTKVDTPVEILVLGNDVDQDGDALTITESTAPANGTVSVNSDGTITYTPNAKFSGTDSFYYTITDGYAVSTAKVTVTIDVAAVLLPKVWKKASEPELDSDGRFSWTYTITVYNDTNQDIDSVQVVDNMDDVFKDNGCTYEVTSIVAFGTLWANGLYNGSDITQTLISDSSYVRAGSINSIVIKVKVNTHSYVGKVYNQANLGGRIVGVGSRISNVLSDDISLSGLTDPTVTDIPNVELLIPDGFSPNDDSFNQTLIIRHADYTQLSLEVYNRWGNLVYKNYDYHGEWDGKGTGNFLGKDLPAGTYYCVCKLTNKTTGEIMSDNVKFITLRR